MGEAIGDVIYKIICNREGNSHAIDERINWDIMEKIEHTIRIENLRQSITNKRTEKRHAGCIKIFPY